jgi:hypothetical protein
MLWARLLAYVTGTVVTYEGSKTSRDAFVDQIPASRRADLTAVK